MFYGHRTITDKASVIIVIQAEVDLRNRHDIHTTDYFHVPDPSYTSPTIGSGSQKGSKRGTQSFFFTFLTLAFVEMLLADLDIIIAFRTGRKRFHIPSDDTGPLRLGLLAFGTDELEVV